MSAVYSGIRHLKMDNAKDLYTSSGIKEQHEKNKKFEGRRQVLFPLLSFKYAEEAIE